MFRNVVTYFPRRNLFSSCERKNLIESKHPEAKPAQVSNKSTQYKIGLNDQPLSDWEKKLFVFFGFYKKNEVPDWARVSTINQHKSKIRIKVSLFIMLITLIACFFASVEGKRKAHSGDSITKRILDYNEKLLTEKEIKKN